MVAMHTVVPIESLRASDASPRTRTKLARLTALNCELQGHAYTNIRTWCMYHCMRDALRNIILGRNTGSTFSNGGFRRRSNLRSEKKNNAVR